MNAVAQSLARHALGLCQGRTTSYRNYFTAGEHHSDYAEWMRMVGAGDAVRIDKRHLFGGDWLFKLTPKGATAALRSGERLDPHDFPKEAV